MKKVETMEMNTDKLFSEVQRIEKTMQEMEEERTKLMQRADMLTADILRAQGALAALQKVAKETSDEAE